MTSQTPRPDPVRSEPPGYRGALPTREDRLARTWVLTVMAIFVLILVLAVLGVPSRFIPEPTVIPLPSTPASSSVEPSASASESASASASESASASASESASPSASPSGE
jgi:cytoskeletal protein RodZ